MKPIEGAPTVSRRKSAMFPVSIKVDSGNVSLDGRLASDGTLIYSVEQAQNIIDQLKSVLSEIENEGFVQVRFGSRGSRYTYSDPSGKLEAGDIVLAPTALNPHGAIATVVARGRGNYGYGTRTIIAKLVKEEINAE